MGIYLNYGKMPESCDSCDFCNEDGICMASGGDEIPEEYFTTVSGKPEWCPVVCEVTVPHGRLIDEDKVLKDFDFVPHYFVNIFETRMMQIILDQPTVIEAEEK